MPGIGLLQPLHFLAITLVGTILMLVLVAALVALVRALDARGWRELGLDPDGRRPPPPREER